jgi:IrrE N-terminal-like domain
VIRAKFIESQAAALLAEGRMTRPPVSLSRLSTLLGVEVRSDVPLTARMKAHYDPISRTVSLARLSPHLLRFPHAHELGHVQLRHGGSCSFEGEPSVEAVPLDEADVRLDEEGEADNFAGAILVPRQWLRDRIDSRTRDQLLAEFEVTLPVLLISAMRYRLINRLRLD